MTQSLGGLTPPPPRPNVSNLGIFKMENFGTPVPIFLNIQKEATCYNSMTENIFGLQKKKKKKVAPPPLQNPSSVAIGFSSGISTHAPADHN